MNSLVRQRASSNWLDKTIGFFSPKAALSRQLSRNALISVRGYEGASTGRRTDGWRVAAKSADTEIKAGAVNLRDRARDLVRNTPQGKAILRELSNNIIGSGIQCVPRAADPKNKRAAKQRDVFAAQWKKWVKSTNCEISGMQTFYGVQHLAMKTIIQSGEVLAIRVRTTDAIPFRIQLLEPEYLDATKDVVRDDLSRASQGVEYSKSGMRIGYWIFDRHPTIPGATSSLYSVDDVAHSFDQDRPGQTRGVSWMHAVILRMRDFADYEDAQLLRQKLAACFMGFVYDADGEPDTEDTSVPTDKFEPATIERLGPGKKIEFANPPAANGYGEFRNGVQHDIASGSGVTYEQMTGDYSKVNYSSARMGWLSFQRSVDVWRWQMFIPQFCDKVYGWFEEAMQITAGIPVGSVASDWVAPRREMVDPTREIPATRDAIRSGLMTQSEAIRERGYEPEDVFNEMQADNAAVDERKLILDSDPRRVSAAGLTQVRPGASAYPDPQDSPTPAAETPADTPAAA